MKDSVDGGAAITGGGGTGRAPFFGSLFRMKPGGPRTLWLQVATEVRRYPEQFEDMKEGLGAWWRFMRDKPYEELDRRLFPERSPHGIGCLFGG